MKFSFLILLSIVILGCSPEITTLKQYSKEQDLIEREVARDKERLALLIEDIKQEKLKQGISKRRFVSIYGKPVIEQISQEKNLWELLYRDPLKAFAVFKVYVYFDEQDKLISWILEEPEEN